MKQADDLLAYGNMPFCTEPCRHIFGDFWSTHVCEGLDAVWILLYDCDFDTWFWCSYGGGMN